MNSKEMFGYQVFEDGTVIGKKGKIMSPSDNGRGYLILGLMCGEERITFAVHRLVALCFVDNPLKLPEVNHKDGDKTNNHFSNLEWCSRGSNIQHAFETKLRSATGENNSRCKTNESTVKEICVQLELGKSCAYIRDRGYDYNLIRAIKSRKNWNHISKDYLF